MTEGSWMQSLRKLSVALLEHLLKAAQLPSILTDHTYTPVPAWQSTTGIVA